MEWERKNKTPYCEQVKSKSRSSHVGPFLEVLEDVREQVEIQCFDECDQKQAEEICMIIAEIYKLPPQTEVQINGQKLPAALVAEIYELLICEHIREVIKKYEAAEYEIKFKKTYIRTALYNTVFEYQSGEVNEMSQFYPEYRPKRSY